MEARPYAVTGDESRIDAWSTVRLPFEPKGWLREYRDELQKALRSMKATPASVLYGQYAGPKPAVADLENVLFYNIGSGCYAHLAQTGMVGTRRASDDGLHHMNYTCPPATDVIIPNAPIIASGQLSSMPAGSTPAHWWACLRERLDTDDRKPLDGEFGVVIEAGAGWRRGLAPSVKSLVDGLVAALHVHDGSEREHVTAALNGVGDGERLWKLLNDPQTAILGRRRLVRPHGQKIAWNPADERCAYFAIIRSTRQEALTVSVIAL